jgi:hypothetical protein
LLDILGFNIPLVVQVQKKVLGDLVVQRKGSPGVIVEQDSEPAETLFHQAVIAIDYLLGRDVLPIRPDGDGNAMLVGTADKQDIVTFEPLITYEDIGGNIGARQMAEVQGAVRIRQCRSNKEFFWQVSL